jgi:Bacterial regulatory helix-turn-helix protein, lysR family
MLVPAGGTLLRTIYWATPVWPTSMPSLRSSPWILGAPTTAHLMHVQLPHLRYVVAAADHFKLPACRGRASHHTQPTLSKRIRELEDRLGVLLSARSIGGAQLTSSWSPPFACWRSWRNTRLRWLPRHLRFQRSVVQIGNSESFGSHSLVHGNLPPTRRIGSGRFRKDQTRLEAAAAAHGRGNQGQAAADLLHHTVDDGEPETSARADR